MKKIIASMIPLSLLLLMQCKAPQPIQYNFPAEMSESIRASYTVQCEKGRILYDMNCGPCHNVGKGRKKTVPDFRQEQLIGYGLRIANARHESSLPDTLVSEEDLGLIMNFLTYKQASGVPAVNKK